jgi:large subunit ribosomal protein L5
MNNIKIKYKKEIAPALQKEFNLSSVMEIPKLEKIIINSGVGEAAQDAKNIELASKELELISGQKPLITKSKKSIATYKLRQGQAIGVKVTLRDEKM